MTASEALDAANNAEPGERLRRHESRCHPQGGCRAEPLQNDPSRWTWCPDCMTVYDAYGHPVNLISESGEAGGHRADNE